MSSKAIFSLCVEHIFKSNYPCDAKVGRGGLGEENSEMGRKDDEMDTKPSDLFVFKYHSEADEFEC